MSNFIEKTEIHCLYKNLDQNNIKGEIWKDITGYEGLYQISNMGRVKSLNYRHTKTPCIMKQNIYNNGYLSILLSKDGIKTKFLVHRLVGLAFIPNLECKPEINHINEIKTDNRVNNLEWVTRKENNSYGTRNQRSSEIQSKAILQYDLEGNLIREWKSMVECGQYGFDQGHISKCCNGKRKTHRNSVWKFKDQ